MEQAQAFLAHPLVQGAITGFIGAAAADYAAFRSWKSVDDARAYDWGVAAWRWFQGVVGGVVGALGIGLVS